jgi:hypothetical protein
MAVYRHSYVFRMAVNPVLRIWTGHGPLATPADIIDPTGATWLGGAHILSVPTLKVLIGGIADRVEIAVNGVDSETLRLVQEDRGEVRDADVRIGRVEFNDDWQVAGPIIWEWWGYADTLTVGSQQSEKGRERRITLSIRTGDTSRSNPLLAFFTDADQRRRAADDAFFSHVASINRGVTRRFGPTS